MYLSPVAEKKKLKSIWLLVSICCAYLPNPVFQLRYIRFISRSQTLTNLVASKFNKHTSVVLLPSVDNQASKSVSRRQTINRNGASFYYLMG